MNDPELEQLVEMYSCTAPSSGSATSTSATVSSGLCGGSDDHRAKPGYGAGYRWRRWYSRCGLAAVVAPAKTSRRHL